MRKLLTAVLMVLFLAGAYVYSQEGVGNVYGTVLDDQNTPLPGVNIELRGERIGLMTATTSANGNFRFLNLPIGSYEIKIELPGFQTQAKSFRLSAGDVAEFRLTLEAGELTEEITVIAPSALVSTKRATVSSTLTKEQYESLPAAKSLMGVLDMVAGVLIDATDVGLSQYGTEVVGMGSNRSNTSWVMDGGDVSSSRFSGRLGATMNMNAVEEVEVSQGAHDVEAEAGGMRVNFVTKRGGNRVSGDLYTYIQDKDVEFKKDLPSDMLAINPNFVTPGVDHVAQYGFNLGGPILKDNIWYFLSYNSQSSKTRTVADDLQEAFAPAYFGKMNFQYKNTMIDLQVQRNKATNFFSVWTDPSYFDAGSVWDRIASSKIFQAGIQQVWGNLILNLKYSFMDSGSVQDPRGSTLDNNTTQGAYSTKKTMYSDTDFWIVVNGQTRVLYQGTLPWWEDTNQRTHVKGNANYYAENLFSGDHEIKFGGEYHDGAYIPQNIYPNHRLVYIYRPGDPPSAPRNFQVEKYDNNYDVFMAYTANVGNTRVRRMNFYLQDTATYGRLTLNAGLRLDKIWFEFLDMTGAGYRHRTVGAAQGVADVIPSWDPFIGDLAIKGYKVDDQPIVLSPRLAANYDLTGDGKTMLRLTTALYGPKLEGSQGHAFWPLSFRSITVPFWDLNGNYMPDLGEFDAWTPFEIDDLRNNRPPGANWVGNLGYGGFDKNDPTRTTSRNKFADDYRNPKTFELTMTFDRELFTDFAISASGIFKRSFDDERALTYYADGHINSAEDYAVLGYDPETDQYIFNNTRGGGVGTVYTNYDKTHHRYLGLKLEATKRLSNKWMMAASVVLQDWSRRDYLEEQLVPAGYKPTNWDYYVNGPFALGALNEGYFINSRWIIKLNGLYQLPLGFNVSWNFRIREGYPVDRGYPVKQFMGAWLQDPTKKFGDDRLPVNHLLNLGLEKVFTLSEGIRATLMLNLFNALNHLNVEKREWRPGPRQGSIINVNNPGLIQFGARVNF
jgi:hypothetical protein